MTFDLLKHILLSGQRQHSRLMPGLTEAQIQRLKKCGAVSAHHAEPIWNTDAEAIFNSDSPTLPSLDQLPESITDSLPQSIVQTIYDQGVESEPLSVTDVFNYLGQWLYKLYGRPMHKSG